MAIRIIRMTGTLIAILVVLTVSLIGTAAAAPSAPSPTPTPPAPQGFQRTADPNAKPGEAKCDIFVSRTDAKTGDARVIADTCSPDPAKRQVPSEARALPVVLLAELWQHYGLDGLWARVWGDAGPCDSAGYRISDALSLNNTVLGISSYVGANNCNGSTLYNNPYFVNVCGRFTSLVVYYVGDACNDRVGSMRLYKF